MSEVTRILNSLDDEGLVARELLPLVYKELQSLATARIANEVPGQTLHSTDLVHEAYLRLVGNNNVTYRDRAHFFGAAAEAMRRILIERARKRNALKRGGNVQRADLDLDQVECGDDSRMLALHDALTRLEEKDATKARVVKLRFFAGLTNREVAEMLALSTATTERHWRFARAWLQKEMH